MPRGRPKGSRNRKTRVTKEEIKKVREDKKITSYKAKKKVIPGPWTERKTKIKKVDVKLKVSSGIMAEILGPAYGNYTKDELPEKKGWYPIVFNLQLNTKMLALIKDEKKKPKYGTVVFLRLGSDGYEDKGFISIHAKTNKKSISGFRAIRKNEYVVLP